MDEKYIEGDFYRCGQFDSTSASGYIESREFLVKDVNTKELGRCELNRLDFESALVGLPQGVVLPNGDRFVPSDVEFRWRFKARDGLLERLEVHKIYYIILIFLVSGLVFFVSTKALPLVGDRIAAYISEDLKKSLSEQVLTGMMSSPNWRESKLTDVRRQELVKRMSLALSAIGLKHPAAWFLFKDGAPNAFALPDGRIIFTDGLVRLLDSDEFLAVALHEIGHVQNNHGIKNLTHNYANRALFWILASQFSTTYQFSGDWVSKFFTLGYTRKNELEADTFAGENLMKANMSPSILADALLKIDSMGERGGSNLLSTHPLTKDRVGRLR